MTFILWTIGMVLFRCENMHMVSDFILTLTSPIQYNIVTRNIFKKVFNGYFPIVFIVSILYSVGFFKFIEEKVKGRFINIFFDLVLIILFIYAIMEMIANGFNPFIYFRF